MFKKAFHLVFTVCGMLLGLGVSQAGIEWLRVHVGEIDQITAWCLIGSACLIFGIIFHFIYSLLGGPKDLSDYELVPRAK